MTTNHQPNEKQTQNSMATPTAIRIKLKWNKQTFENLNIEIGEKASDFKERVQALTGVPIERQKLLAGSKKGWKGSLSSDIILELSLFKDPSSVLNVTLIGSAEVLAPTTQTTKFIEDMSPEDLAAEEYAQEQEAMKTAEGMIPLLQLPPHKRDDHKQETYQYNRLVTGLPQRQIEQELKYAQKQKQLQQAQKETDNGMKGETSQAPTTSLQGKVAMQLGLELRRAYINDLAVLEDGTCVSVLDEGHVQLWKNASQQQDVTHQGFVREGGVDSVVALNTLNVNTNRAAFATAGRGCVQLWTSDADPIATLQGAMPGGTSPASLQSVFGGTTTTAAASSSTSDSGGYDKTTICLAARFEITRQSDPSQFRLPPQNEVERQRRAQAEAQERAVQEALAKASRSIQVWFASSMIQPQSPTCSADSDTQQRQRPSLSTQILEPPLGDLQGSGPIACLATISVADSYRILVAGDTSGGIRLWRAQHNDGRTVQFSHLGLLQLTTASVGVPSSTMSSCSVVCMESLSGGRLAVSTDYGDSSPRSLVGAVPMWIPASRGVHIIDLSELLKAEASVIASCRIVSTLTGHTKDSVICMCELPDGALLTGGGKLDATLQVWSQSQIDGSQQPNKTNLEKEATKEEEGGITMQESQLTMQAKAIKTFTDDVGYVFAVKVLPDAKDDSNYYAIAAARYNTIKVII